MFTAVGKFSKINLALMPEIFSIEGEQRNQMKTHPFYLGLISGNLFTVAILTAVKVSPPVASAILFAFFMASSIAVASFAIRRQTDLAIRDVLSDEQKGVRK